MPVRRRPKTHQSSQTGRLVFRTCLLVLLAAVGMRLLLDSGLGAHLESALTGLGQDVSLANRLFSAGTGRTDAALPDAAEVLKGQVPVFAGFGDQLAEEDYTVPEGGALPPLSTSQAGQILDGEDTNIPAASDAPDSTNPDAHRVIPITVNPTSSKGYEYYDGVYIKNQTDLAIDVARALSNLPDITLKKDQPQVLILHTHGTESFLADNRSYYLPEDVTRTEDTNYNIVKVGDEIADLFKSRGISVIHDRTLYDSPSYAGSYTRALAAIQKTLEENPSIQVVLDVHRDAIIGSDGTSYAKKTEIDGEEVAQVMLVMGTDEGGLSHPDWKSNLRLAVKIQRQMAEKYPTLARPLDLRASRFNQHATKGSMLVEVGTAANTLEEAVAAGKLFADCAADVLLEYVE